MNQHHAAIIVHGLIMSGKAHFEMSKFVTKRNMRFWNEGELHLKPHHNYTATLGYGAGYWMSMSPYFFEY